MCTVLLPPGVNPIAVNKYISQVTGYEPKIRGSLSRQNGPGITSLIPNQYRGTSRGVKREGAWSLHPANIEWTMPYALSPSSSYASKMCLGTGKTAPFAFTFTCTSQFMMTTYWRYSSLWGSAPVIQMMSSAFPQLWGVCDGHNDTPHSANRVRQTPWDAHLCVSLHCEVCFG